jgi:nitroreductase
VDAFLAVVSKREVREYDDRPLPDAAVRRILDAGRLAGSSRNRQQRRFVVLRDRALREHAAEAVHAPDNLLGAALVVAIVVHGKGPTTFDAGRAAQNMMLAAHAEGIGSCPNGVADREGMQAVLGHDDDEQVATLLSFGYPVHARDPARRTPDEWIARADRLPYEELIEER